MKYCCYLTLYLGQWSGFANRLSVGTSLDGDASESSSMEGLIPSPLMICPFPLYLPSCNFF